MFLVHSSSGLRALPRSGKTQTLCHTRKRICSSRPTHRALRVVQTRAMGESFDLNLYYEAHISEIRSADKEGHVVYLRLQDGLNSSFRVFIGEFECGAMVKEMSKKGTNNSIGQSRPGTHDLMKNMLEALGYRVTKIRITALVGNTYHARVHFGRGRGIKSADGAPSATEIDIDARPSDALNLALRFSAPIYVNKDVAAKMSIPSASYDDRHVSAAAAAGSHATPSPSAGEIANSCREEILQYVDPTIMHKLQLQLAIAEERFEEASKLRDVIEKTLASDRALALVVAIETALEDNRFEEAARLRDEFRKLRLSQQQQPKTTSDVTLDM